MERERKGNWKCEGLRKGFGKREEVEEGVLEERVEIEEERFELVDQFTRPGSGRLSHALRHSTIGAEGFHGRVRDGIACGPLARTTRSCNLIYSRSAFLAADIVRFFVQNPHVHLVHSGFSLGPSLSRLKIHER